MKTKTLPRIFIFILIYIRSGALWSNTQLFEVAYLQEAYLLVLIIFTLVYFSRKTMLSEGVVAEEVFIILLVFFLMLVPSFFAYFSFEQPFYFGLIEERRALSYLVFFPIYFALRNENISPIWIVNVILAVCLINLVNSVWFFLNIRAEYVIETINSMNARFDRAIIGAYYMFFAYFYLLWDWVKKNRKLNLLFLFVILFYFILLVQSKQMIGVLLLVTAFVMVGHLKKSMWLLTTSSTLLLLIYWLVDLGDFIEKYQVVINAVIGGGESIRSKTATLIINDLSETMFILGKGSLSLLWNDGFHSIFGEHFYLSDVGLLGMYYKLGVLAIPLTVIYYGFFMHCYFRLGKLRLHVIPLAAVTFVLCSMVLNALVPVIEYNGYNMSVILALLAGYYRSVPLIRKKGKEGYV